jgi:hypothetical protein
MSVPTITISAWAARLALPLLIDKHARMRARADADPRWAPEALRLATAVREMRAALDR